MSHYLKMMTCQWMMNLQLRKIILINPTHTEDNDNLVDTKIPLQHKGEIQQGEVVNRKRDTSGLCIGTHHINPTINSREYQV